MRAIPRKALADCDDTDDEDDTADDEAKPAVTKQREINMDTKEQIYAHICKKAEALKREGETAAQSFSRYIQTPAGREDYTRFKAAPGQVAAALPRPVAKMDAGDAAAKVRSDAANRLEALAAGMSRKGTISHADAHARAVAANPSLARAAGIADDAA